jgi:hypothetical protein
VSQTDFNKISYRYDDDFLKVVGRKMAWQVWQNYLFLFGFQFMV